LWGLTEGVIERTRELARHGYLAVAPDLYQGRVATDAPEAAALRRRRRSTPAWRQIVGLLDHARSGHPASSLGLVGYSMGGHWALWLASQRRSEVPIVRATVVYYATRACDFTASRSAVQLHLAEADPFVTPSGVAALERALRQATRPCEIYRYPQTGHWFAERDRDDAFRPEAARLAWDRTVVFLDTHLEGETP
jgi:carboxymethylenebutenolidase